MLRNFPEDRNPASARCPACGLVGTLRPHGKYERWLWRPGEDAMTLVSIRRSRCCGCGKTHALLPVGVVPYCAICLCVMAAICIAKKRGAKVSEICERFGISVRTLYRVLEREPAARSMLAAADAAASIDDLASPETAAGPTAAFLSLFSRMPFEKVTLSRRAAPRGQPP